MPYRALVPLTILALGLCAVAIFLPLKEAPPPTGQPAPAGWEAKAWAESSCDRCGKGLSANPQDGLYIINRQPYWLHQRCVAPVVKAARR